MSTEIEAASMRVSRVIEKAVYDPAGEKIGSIGDILVDTAGSEITVVVHLDGALTTSEVAYELPFSILEYRADVDGYFVPFTKEELSTGAAASEFTDETSR